jgi:hypothetical protein
MRSGLSLRIPGIKELSPSHGSIKSSSMSFSFAKPSSPRPSESKNHHRTPTHSSAYHRITSTMTIKKLSLPSFLRVTRSDCDDILNKIPLGKTGVSLNSECPTDSSSIKTSNEDPKKPQSNLLVPQTPQEFISSVFGKTASREEMLLQVGKIKLCRGELQTLHPKTPLSRNIIDACLRCLKHKNRKFFKNAESHDRVLIINTNFSQNIFSSKKETKLYSVRNPLKYE